MARTRAERAGAYSYAFLVGCLLYFRFFLRPLVSTPLASHKRKTRCETRNYAREIPTRQRTPLPLAKLSHTSLSSFFLSLFPFFLFFRFYVALRFSKEGLFSPPLHSLVVYLLLENSSTSRMQREERRRHVNRFWGMILKKRRGCVWSGVRVIYLLYWNYLINGWKKVKIYC